MVNMSKKLAVLVGVTALALLVGCDESFDSKASDDSFSYVTNGALDTEALPNLTTWDSDNSDLPSAYSDEASSPTAHCPEPTTLALFPCGAGVMT